jgi:hypothetical protein
MEPPDVLEVGIRSVSLSHKRRARISRFDDSDVGATWTLSSVPHLGLAS